MSQKGGSALADDLQESLAPILKSQELLNEIPALMERKRWDDIRNILAPAPVGKLQQTMVKAASLVGDDDAFEELDEVLDNLQNMDMNVYMLAVQFPSESKEKQYLAAVKEALDRVLKGLDRFLSFFSEEQIEKARQ